MPTNRTRKKRHHFSRINDRAVKAWLDCDYMALHSALGLAPWEMSPLPFGLCVLGVHESAREHLSGRLFDKSFDKALELQRELIAVAGPPSKGAMLRVLEKRLGDEVEFLLYLRTQIKAGDVDEREKDMLPEAEEDVATSRDCIAQIDAWRKQMREEVAA